MEQIDLKIVEEPGKPMSMHPKKFGLWVFLASVIMLFASLTSAYIVRRADGNWTYFDLPQIFWLTTVVVLLSSVTMQWAYFSAKKDNLETTRVMLVLTFVLGVGFTVGQIYGLIDLDMNQIHFADNPSGSFVYVLTGLHAAHILSAMIFLLITLVSALRLNVHSRNLARIEMCATYWHFLGGLWLYLFVFLLLNRA